MNAEARANRRAKILCAICFAVFLTTPFIGILVGTGTIPFAP